MKGNVSMTIMEKVSKITGVHTEASYQMINQRGVLNGIWKRATEVTEKDFPDLHSKEHQRVKFLYAPLALVVYVSKAKDVKNATRKIAKVVQQLLEQNSHLS